MVYGNLVLYGYGLVQVPGDTAVRIGDLDRIGSIWIESDRFVLNWIDLHRIGSIFIESDRFV